jgi:hypothetical protein
MFFFSSISLVDQFGAWFTHTAHEKTFYSSRPYGGISVLPAVRMWFLEVTRRSIVGL